MSDRLPDDATWTAFDEHNLLLEISEERRLRDLGIDPDMHPLAILEALLKLDDEEEKPESESSELDDLDDEIIW